MKSPSYLPSPSSASVHSGSRCSGRESVVTLGSDVSCLRRSSPIPPLGAAAQSILTMKSLENTAEDVCIDDVDEESNAITRCCNPLKRFVEANLPRSAKKRKVIVTTPAGHENEHTMTLHRACSENFEVGIEMLLEVDPEAARRPAETLPTTAGSGTGQGNIKGFMARETYSYPLNIAIQHGVNNDAGVLEQLTSASTSVLAVRDGKELETPLFVLLKYRPNDVATTDHMLLGNERCVSTKDRHLNTPLHAACAHGACLEIIRHLYILYPEAAEMRNFHGQTPLELAQFYTSTCSEDVVNFLQEQQRQHSHGSVQFD